MSGNDLLEQMNVSRETLDRLEAYEGVVRKWNPKINLVSRNSLDHLRTRHILDSVQVFRCVDSPAGHWVDLGSGGGFPGIVVAIMAKDETPDLKVTLIESDQRKSAFLRAAARECGVQVTVLSQRIEQAPPQNASILSARALADLSLLLEFSEMHLNPQGAALFPKGARWKKEVDNSRQHWRFDAEQITSLTEPDAVVLKLKGIARV